MHPCLSQEIVKTTTQRRPLGFSRTQREVVASCSQSRGGSGAGQRAKIVDRRAKIGFHNGHTLVLSHEVSGSNAEEGATISGTEAYKGRRTQSNGARFSQHVRHELPARIDGTDGTDGTGRVGNTPESKISSSLK